MKEEQEKKKELEKRQSNEDIGKMLQKKRPKKESGIISEIN